MKQGKEKVSELTQRFGNWYYVISSDSFSSFKVTRDDVVSLKADKDAQGADAGPGGLPGQLPGGLDLQNALQNLQGGGGNK